MLIAASNTMLLLGAIQPLLLIDQLHTLERNGALQLQQTQELLEYMYYQSHLENTFH
jgi:hypothetical protein